ncbi:MAG TPA: diaminopimelate epimerase, partial [Chlamydiales bacterium]|nr:diaminopimelate epimerase [Chlamydiales bacterium]
MSKLTYAKYEGAGNTFILIDDRAPFFDKNLVPQLCHRENVDGLILLQLDPEADFRMRIFNRDGSEAESCGNGLRCLIRFIADLGFPRRLYRIAMADRIVEGEFVGDNVRIQLGEPRDLKLHLKIDSWTVHFVDTGVPHLVIFVPDVDAVDLLNLGPYFRHHPQFQPRGTNVNFAELQKDGSLKIRTYERGVEGEVAACGTGAAAVGFIAPLLFPLPSTAVNLLTIRGQRLKISWSESCLSLEG